MSAEFVVDPRPNSNHFVENHTLGNVNFLFTNFGLFSCCICRLKKSVSAALATKQEELNEETERNQKNCEILEFLSRNFIFSWKERFR